MCEGFTNAKKFLTLFLHFWAFVNDFRRKNGKTHFFNLWKDMVLILVFYCYICGVVVGMGDAVGVAVSGDERFGGVFN